MDEMPWCAILSVTSHINCIVTRWLITIIFAIYLNQVNMTLHVSNDVINNIESTQNLLITLKLLFLQENQ